MGIVEGALVSAQQPSLDQRGDAVHSGQQLVGIRPPSTGRALAAPIMVTTELRQRPNPLGS